MRSIARAAFVVAAGLAAFAAGGTTAHAAEVTVMISGGFAPALRELAPAFTRETGHTIAIVAGPSMGTTPQAIPARLQRGEPADAVIMVGYALDRLIKAGTVDPASRVDLARSRIGMAVRAGAPKPDISTVDAFKRTLLEAKSIAYSDSASGVYLADELFARLGLADRLKPKSSMIPADPVGGVVARGDAEIGFQQISELRAVPGIDVVGPIPAELQKITVYSAGVVNGAAHADAARALLAFLRSPGALAVVTRTGMDPP